MDVKFDNLISQQIKRLSRPKFKNEFVVMHDPQDNESKTAIDPKLEEIITDESVLLDLRNICDISYDGVPSSAAMNFNPAFGKICQGENFKVLYTIQNSSPKHTVDQLDIKCTVIQPTFDKDGNPT